MDVGRRAKQFAPFAALRGLDETIRQQEIIYEPKRDLSEEKKNELDMKLRILVYGMKIQATYFQKSWKNPLIGQYHTLSGTVEFFDPSVHLRIDDTEIQIQDICDLTGDVFETIEIWSHRWSMPGDSASKTGRTLLLHKSTAFFRS